MKKFFSIILIILVSCSLSFAARTKTDLLVLYDFLETRGTIIYDKSGVDPALNLTISDPTKITWLPVGLKVDAATVIKTVEPRTKLDPNVFATKGFTIEVWIKPANNTQSGPARIVSFSQDSGNRNFTFGQSADAWDQRFRTSDNPGNGSSPSLSSPAATIADPAILQHVIYTRESNGQATIYVNGSSVATASITGDLSNWDMTYDFGLFNEMNYPTDTRTWLGEIYLVAIYGKSLTANEVTANYDFGLPAIPIPAPTSLELGNLATGDKLHAQKVNFIIPKEIRGDYILSYEINDIDVDNEVEIQVNEQVIETLSSITANNTWSPVRTIKIEDIRLCDDNMENIITFNNIYSTGPSTWGVRNVSIKRGIINSSLTLYTDTTDKDITVTWDAVVDANYPDIHYDFFLWNHGEEDKYLIGGTQQTQVTFKLPRTGLWVFYARTCDKARTETDKICSSWAHSNLTELDGTLFGQVEDPTNPGTYIPGNWMIYGHIAPPTQ